MEEAIWDERTWVHEAETLSANDGVRDASLDGLCGVGGPGSVTESGGGGCGLERSGLGCGSASGLGLVVACLRFLGYGIAVGVWCCLCLCRLFQDCGRDGGRGGRGGLYGGGFDPLFVVEDVVVRLCCGGEAWGEVDGRAELPGRGLAR